MKRKGSFNNRYSKQTGVGLIEVLIAVLVFAVGLLGMTSMQLAAKRSNYEATQRSIATGLARDIIERMRSNPGEVDSYVASDLGGSTLSFAVNCNTNECTTAELAQRDLFEWALLLRGVTERITIDGSTSNAGGLVSPRACITNNAGNVTVAIAWRGVSEMTNPNESTCGEGSGLYGDSNSQRRLMVVTTYIGNV